MKFSYDKAEVQAPILEEYVEDMEFDSEPYENQTLLEGLVKVLQVESDIVFY